MNDCEEKTKEIILEAAAEIRQKGKEKSELYVHRLTFAIDKYKESIKKLEQLSEDLKDQLEMHRE